MYFGLKSMFYKYQWGWNNWTQPKVHTTIKHLELICAKRDSAAFQVIVASDYEFMLTLSHDPLFWKGGPLNIARMELQLDTPLNVNIKLIGLMEDDDRRQKSDILLDTSHIFVEKRKLQQIWIELEAGANTPAGLYSGKLRLFTHILFEDEVLHEDELTFSLTVLEDQLPEPKDYLFYLDLWQHNSNIARKYDVELWSEQHFDIIDSYMESMAQLGQKALSVVVSEIPWSGQNSHMDLEPSDLFEYSMIKVTRKRDGSLSYDFSAVDRYVQIGRKYGITGEIELFGLLSIWQNEAGYGSIVEDYPDGIRVRYYDELEGRYRFIRKRNELEAYLHVLEAYWMDIGLIDKVRVMADEPADFAMFEQSMACLEKMAPSLLCKVAINHVEFIQKNIKGMHDYVPSLQCAAYEADRLNELKSTIPGKLLFYIAGGPDKPNTLIGSPGIDSRVIPWLVERMQYDGFLRWNYTAWPERPLERIGYKTACWPAGDTNFVYPGATGKPVLSLRYKWLQRGIRDYEYMQMLKQQGHAEEVKAALDNVFNFENTKDLYVSGRTTPQFFSSDPEDYDRMYRRRL
jgi:hypothetical protein